MFPVQLLHSTVDPSHALLPRSNGRTAGRRIPQSSLLRPDETRPVSFLRRVRPAGPGATHANFGAVTREVASASRRIQLLRHADAFGTFPLSELTRRLLVASPPESPPRQDIHAGVRVANRVHPLLDKDRKPRGHRHLRLGLVIVERLDPELENVALGSLSINVSAWALNMFSKVATAVGRGGRKTRSTGSPGISRGSSAVDCCHVTRHFDAPKSSSTRAPNVRPAKSSMVQGMSCLRNAEGNSLGGLSAVRPNSIDCGRPSLNPCMSSPAGWLCSRGNAQT